MAQCGWGHDTQPKRCSVDCVEVHRNYAKEGIVIYVLIPDRFFIVVYLTNYKHSITLCVSADVTNGTYFIFSRTTLCIQLAIVVNINLQIINNRV